MANNKDINRQVKFEKIMLNFCLLLTKRVSKARTQRVHNTVCWTTVKHVQSGDGCDCVDMTSKCESVFVPIETVLGLSDTQTGEIKTSEKFDYLSEASVTELLLAENKSPDTSVSFSDEYCNHTNDRGYAAFHEELHPDVIRGKLSGLSDKSVQRRITNLSRNKTIEKVALRRCWNRETLVCESDDFIFQFDLKKRILQHLFVKQDCRKMTALENEAVFVVTSWASEDTSK